MLPPLDLIIWYRHEVMLHQEDWLHVDHPELQIPLFVDNYRQSYRHDRH